MSWRIVTRDEYIEICKYGVFTPDVKVIRGEGSDHSIIRNTFIGGVCWPSSKDFMFGLPISDEKAEQIMKKTSLPVSTVFDYTANSNRIMWYYLVEEPEMEF